MRIVGALIAVLMLAGCSSETPSGGDKAEVEKPAATAEQTVAAGSETGAADTVATAAPVPTAVADTQGDAAAPQVKAVLMYAEWCGSCKILDPKLKAVQAKGAIAGVDYVVLDFTDKNADALFAKADQKGVGPAIRARFADQVKTGLLLLVDVQSGRIVNEVSKAMTEEEIEAALKAAVAPA